MFSPSWLTGCRLPAPVPQLFHAGGGQDLLLGLARIQLGVGDAVVAQEIHDLARGGAVLGQRLAQGLSQAVQGMACRDLCSLGPALHARAERLGAEGLAPGGHHQVLARHVGRRML